MRFMNGRSTSEPSPDRDALSPADRRDPGRRQPRDEPEPHPLQTAPADPPPPAREQLPLPRRAGQENLEPQLRNPGGIGTGSPFAAFAATVPSQATAGERDPAADFLNGSHQGRDRARRSTGGTR